MIGCSAGDDGIPSIYRPPRGAVRTGVTLKPRIKNSTIILTEGGIPIPRAHPEYNYLSMPIHPIDESDLPEFNNFNQVGTSKDIVCILNPAIPASLHLHTVHGFYSPEVPSWSNAGSPRYQVTPIQINGFPKG